MKNTGVHFSGKWENKDHNVQVNLALIIFEEDGYQIVFCPALDLQGAGKTELEAIEAFNITLGEYIKYSLNKKTLLSDLESHGWKVKKSTQKPATPPEMSYLLEKNDEFRRVFDNFDYRKINRSFQMPVFA